jgi:hypothetical protein
MLFFAPAGWGYIGLFFTVPVWLIIWKARYSSLETADPDFKTAKRDWLVALIIWLPALLFSVIIFIW